MKCCKGCTERWVNEHERCHSTCKRYLDEVREKDEKNAAIAKIKKEENEIDSYVARKIAQARHKKHLQNE